MWSAYITSIAALMVVTGTLNTLTMKWSDHMITKGYDGKERPFVHPFIQSCFMFLGEFSCYFVFKILYCYYTRRSRLEDQSQLVAEENELIRGNKNFSVFNFMPAAMLDMVGTTTMYVGLNLTYASSFQMLRGSVIVFTEILSMIFLGRKFKLLRWAGITVIIFGLVLVGVSDFLYTGGAGSEDYTQFGIVAGDILIVLAQIVTASQMVYEEMFCVKLDAPPLKAVGCEGMFGLTILLLLLIPCNFIPIPASIDNNPRHTVEDLKLFFYQLKEQPLLFIALFGNTVSIAFFNFAGISVAKHKTATTRMILDTMRTFFIWAFSLIVKWQEFALLQPVGFIFVALGMALYYNTFAICIPSLQDESNENTDREGLVNSQPADET